MASAVFRLHELMEGRDPPLAVRGLAIQAGLDIKTVRAIRDNAAARVDLETLGRLAGVLGCEPGELIGRGDRKPTKRGGGRRGRAARQGA